jgi:hypothetical protein
MAISEKDNTEQQITKGTEKGFTRALKSVFAAWGMSPAQIKKIEEEKVKNNEKTQDNLDEQNKFIKKSFSLWGIISKGFSGVFKTAKQTSSLFKSTFKFGAKLWENLRDNLMGRMKEIFNTIAGHVREVLGPVAAVYDAAKSALTGFYNFFKSMLFNDKISKGDKKTHGFLKTIADWAKMSIKAKKKEFTESLGKALKEEKGWGKLILILGVIVVVL